MKGKIIIFILILSANGTLLVAQRYRLSINYAENDRKSSSLVIAKLHTSGRMKIREHKSVKVWVKDSIRLTGKLQIVGYNRLSIEGQQVAVSDVTEIKVPALSSIWPFFRSKFYVKNRNHDLGNRLKQEQVKVAKTDTINWGLLHFFPRIGLKIAPSYLFNITPLYLVKRKRVEFPDLGVLVEHRIGKKTSLQHRVGYISQGSGEKKNGIRLNEEVRMALHRLSKDALMYGAIGVFYARITISQNLMSSEMVFDQYGSSLKIGMLIKKKRVLMDVFVSINGSTIKGRENVPEWNPYEHGLMIDRNLGFSLGYILKH